MVDFNKLWPDRGSVINVVCSHTVELYNVSVHFASGSSIRAIACYLCMTSWLEIINKPTVDTKIQAQ